MKYALFLQRRDAHMDRMAGAAFLLCAAVTGLGITARRLFPGAPMLCGGSDCVRPVRSAMQLDEDNRAVAGRLMGSLSSGGMPGGAEWRISLDMLYISTALTLGIAACAKVWPLEAGLKAQRNPAGFL